MVRAIRAYALAFPFLFIGVFLLTWIAARLSLGHWPRPYLDDPKHIGVWVDVPYAVTGALFNVGLPVFLVALAVIAFQAFRDASQRKRLVRAAVVSLLFTIAVMAFLWWDPLRIFEWFAD